MLGSFFFDIFFLQFKKLITFVKILQTNYFLYQIIYPQFSKKTKKMKLKLASVLAVLALMTTTSCSKKEYCTEGNWKYVAPENNVTVFLEIDEDSNAKYNVPNSLNIPGCGANILEASFKLQYLDNSTTAVVTNFTKNNCYNVNYSFVTQNDTLQMACYPTKLYVTRNDTTIYILDKQ